MNTPTIRTSTFVTPKGQPVAMSWRETTADWNNLTSSMVEDEYNLRYLDLTGVALDIGAYIGGVTVGLLTDHPGLKVVSVEPIPENLELLRENADWTDRLTIVEGAVGHGDIRYDYEADDGRVDDFAGQHRYYGNTFGFDLYCAGQDHKSVQAPVYTIADLVPEGDIALCKIDCEGGEYGFFDSPDVARIDLIVGEWHPNGGGPDDIRQLLEPTHDVTIYPHPASGPGNFRAVRR